ncbi:MAG: CBS domain-containing protein [Propionivibrio sp.]|jgi:magnesium and cobalt transporter|uniref:HlyC/CorC family transporter n=1 Tax=Propionivibrio sp. TaxID=2212460 RepID=UPI001B4C396F|nr:transporter associated domain-containing protein [Propionivibrio sp.]MBP7201904.1 CBS domain-containing protein [Propionivibrio sp.]
MDPDKPSFFERISSLLLREPEDREQLMRLLHSAHERKLLDADALSITEGALAASEVSVHDVMVPRAMIEFIDIDAPLEEVIAQVNRTAHSRFPVIDDSRDNVVGILLAKDLLRVRADRPFKLRDWLHPAVFIPESKRLNVLLREFRVSRNHMAIVIDEYAGVSGLITIEDVLEQIVGEIEDEYDFDESEGNIRPDQFGRFRVKAQTTIEDFNEHFGSHFSTDECNTVGGLILNHLGRVPRRKEEIVLGGLNFVVLRADRRRMYTLLVTREQAPDETS